MSSDAPRFLLLNTTNHLVRLAYPYAFVQVSEIARRYGIEVRRLDLHGIPAAQRADVLRRHVREWNPAMIGVTLRNTDSLLSTDYMRGNDNARYEEPVGLNLLEQMTQGLPPYYPTHDTRTLIATLRTLTSAPIMVGGFGFSTQPLRAMNFLGADFGVIGDPDPVLARFDDVLARRSLGSIDNLCYVENGSVHVNPQVFIGPSANREYTDEVIADRNRFFAAVTTPAPATSRSIPIEVMRGCPYLCTFCAEPKVKGNRAQFRDLDVVEAELEFLRGHGHNMVWFICSEINAMGNQFALSLAERVIHINERRPEAERVRWFTYYLLRFSLPELKHLRRSGFLGGWNDIPAFDDRNLKRLRVPYRTRHLLQSIKDVIAVGRDEAAERAQPAASLEEKIVFDPDHRRTLLPDDMLTSPVLTLFLGNQFATVDTVRETLSVMDREGLTQHFDAAFVIRSERVFDYNTRTDIDSAATRSFPPNGQSPTRSIDPTFRFSESLVRQLGSLDAVERFFVYVEDTFLSQNHLFRKDWCWFLANNSSPRGFYALWLEALSQRPQLDAFSSLAPVRKLLGYLASDPSPEKMRLLFSPAAGRKPVAQAAADAAIRVILEALPSARRRLHALFGIPCDASGRLTLSPYAIACSLYTHHRCTDELRSFASRSLDLKADSLEHLALADFIYRHNVELRPEYRAFFVADAADETQQAREDVRRPIAAGGAP